MRSEDYAYLYNLEETFWWFSGMCQITATLLDPICRPGRDCAVLDAGCGTGGMLSWLSRYSNGRDVAGIDLVSDAIDFCRARNHKLLAQASVTHLPFQSSTFDLVTSFDVLVQLPGADSDLAAMREMFRMLRPGGIAFVRVAAYSWMKSSHDEELGTQRRYALAEISKRLESVGFKVLRRTYANTFLLPLVIVRRLMLKPIGLSERGSDVKPLPPGLNWLNSALAAVLRIESILLRRMNLPAGLSAICIVEKPA